MPARRNGVVLTLIGVVILAIALVAPGAAQAEEPAYNATLKADHVGATNPGFETGTCPSAGWGWHFVAQGNSTDFVAIKVTFESAGVITTFTSFPTAKHAYVYTPGPDKLLGAVAQVDGPDREFNLSHVCTGSTTTTSTTTTSTTTTEPTTTTSTTSTSTTTEPPEVLDTTTTTAVPVTTTSNPGGVQDAGQDQGPPSVGSGTLARTGRDVRALVLLGASLVLIGAVLVRRSQLQAA